MKIIAALLTACAFGSGALAGPTYTSAKDAKSINVPPPLSCDCFQPGGAFGIYGGGILDHEDELGGGALVEYFFTEYVGIQASYGIFATDSEHHEIDGSLVLRFPIRSVCLAPYLLLGGGIGTNSNTEGNFFAGAGLEARLDGANCLGVFADGTYHWADDEEEDYTIVRLGLKFPF